MSDLRARLAAKAVRRAVIPIAVSDPSEAEEALRRAHVEAGVLGSNPDQVQGERAAKKVEKAQSDYDECFVDVAFRALGAADYEALLEHFQIDDPDGELDPERDDTVRWDDLLPELLAASAEDEDLRDAEWWAEILAKPEWSQGDKLSLRSRLIHINMEVPARAPKG